MRRNSSGVIGLSISIFFAGAVYATNVASLSKNVGRRPRHHFASSLILTFVVWATIDTAEVPAWTCRARQPETRPQLRIAQAGALGFWVCGSRVTEQSSLYSRIDTKGWSR